MARGRGHVYLRGRLWWIKYYAGGEAVFESSKSTDRSKALELLNRRLNEVLTGKNPASGPRNIRMAALLEALRDDYDGNNRSDAYIAGLRIDKHLLPAIGEVKASEWSTAHRNRYVKARLQTGAAHATINRELALIRRAFTMAHEAEPPKVTKVPKINQLEEDNTREGFIEPEQYHALLQELDRARLPVVIGYHLGNRKGEVLGLKWSMVDLKHREIRLPAALTKNGKARTLPIYGEMESELRAAKEDRDRNHPKCEWVCSDRGQQIKRFAGEWTAATKRAGLDGLMFHDLRRSAVRNMVRAGIPEGVAMKISGHLTRSVFERYNIISAKDLVDAGAKLEAYLPKRPERKPAASEIVERKGKKVKGRSYRPPEPAF